MKIRERAKESRQRKEILPLEKYRKEVKQHKQLEMQMLENLDKEKFLEQHYINQHELRRNIQLDSFDCEYNFF